MLPKFLFIKSVFLLFSLNLLAVNHLVVLQYHHISSKTPPSTSTSPEQFEEHLVYLQNNGFNIVALEETLYKIKSGSKLPDKSIAITFDDAYDSIYDEAFPRLKKRAWPFTVFVASKPVDLGYRNYLSWEHLREMQNSGATISNHSYSHEYLVRKKNSMESSDWRSWIREEIFSNQKRLQEELSSNSKLFAYPYGEFDSELRDIVVSMGYIGVGQQSGVVWNRSDFGSLPRYPLSGIYAGMKQFRLKTISLPLPVLSMNPTSPVLKAKDDFPVLKISLDKGEFNPDGINCFASGQGAIKTSWINRDKRILQIKPNKSIGFGRSKFNCTARHLREPRFFWFSVQWLRLEE